MSALTVRQLTVELTPLVVCVKREPAAGAPLAERPDRRGNTGIDGGVIR